MGKKSAIVIGIAMLCLGATGLLLNFKKSISPPVVKTDLETEGVITQIFADVVEHRLTGIDLSKHYQFEYEFVTEDGEKLHGTETISEDQALALEEGQPITIQYYGHYPSINAAKGYGTYIPVDQMPKSSLATRLLFCGGLCFFGLLLLYSGLTFDNSEEETSLASEPEKPKIATPTPPPANDLEPASEEMQKLERYRKAYLANK